MNYTVKSLSCLQNELYCKQESVLITLGVINNLLIVSMETAMFVRYPKRVHTTVYSSARA